MLPNFFFFPPPGLRGAAFGAESCKRFILFFKSCRSVCFSVLKDFNAVECAASSHCCRGRRPQPSSYSAALKVDKWTVSFAPRPENVFW